MSKKIKDEQKVSINNQDEVDKLVSNIQDKKQKRAKIKPRKTKSKKILIGIVIGILLVALAGGIYYTQLVIIKPQITIESGSVWDKKGSIFIEKQGNLEIKNISYKNTDKNAKHRNELLVETVYYKDGKEVSKDEAVNKETNKLNKGFTSKMVVIGAYNYDIEIKAKDGRIFRTSLKIQDTTKPILKVKPEVTIEEGSEAKATEFFEACEDVNSCGEAYFVKKIEKTQEEIDKENSDKKDSEGTKASKKESSKKKDSKKTSKKTSKQKKMSASKEKSFVAILTNKVGLTEAKAVEKTSTKKAPKKTTKVNDKAKEPVVTYEKIDKPEDLSVGEHEVLLQISDSSGNLSDVVISKLKIVAKPEPEPEEEVQVTGGNYSGGGNSGYRRSSGGSYRGNSGGSSGGNAPAQNSGRAGSQGYAFDYGYGERVSLSNAYVVWGNGKGDLSRNYSGQIDSQFAGASLQMLRECEARYGSCWNQYDNAQSGTVYDVATHEAVGSFKRVWVLTSDGTQVAFGYFKNNGQMQWVNKQF